MIDYKHSEQIIEKKWQNYWAENNIYGISDDITKPKYYVLDMFPYPSGSGLHIGHPEGYTATDIVGRYKRMKGYNVMHTMGFDAFGLPTERYSMQTGIHPIDATNKNIANYIRQLKMLGFGYDWSHSINTTSPKYYKWTQWMFTLIYNSWYDHDLKKAQHIDNLPIPENLKTIQEIEAYKDTKRLAFIANMPVNWCAELGTVLANEEVEEWKNKGYVVERKPMRQWMLKITEYAERLLDDLELVNWPHSTKEMQKNWIGKSVGAEIKFEIKHLSVSENNHSTKNILVFTTRPDTIFGATYIVLAPEHPLVKEITVDIQRQQVDNYIQLTSLKSDLERTELNKTKSGVWTGAFAINPATNEKIPIWIADYVLLHYGTGAIMAVPAHDERDYEFAKNFNLPIKQVVTNEYNNVNVEKKAFCEKSGFCINSQNENIDLNNLQTSDAIKKVINWIVSNDIGKAKTQFKLRDWLFSRQRYWGEPIPIIFFEDGTKRVLELDELPLVLPDVKDFKPANTGESPLANVEDWMNVVDKKTGKNGHFETNTMPQWAGSCWYYLRYIDPNNDKLFVDIDKEKYWMSNGGVDLYIGGAEHAVLHLLYARFWHKILFDYGYVSTTEPFKKLFHQGLIIGEDGRKMSKSLGNVVNPDDVVKEYGADALRMFEMFLGPLEASKPWSKTGIDGVHRFLQRVWKIFIDENGNLNSNIKDIPANTEQEYILNFTIKKVADDIENLSFNTVVSQMMIFLNEFSKTDSRPRYVMEKFVIMLAIYAPHIGEELWHKLGHNDSVVLQKYPEYDKTKLIKNSIELVIQVNSKIRAKFTVQPDTLQTEAEALASKDENVTKHLRSKNIKKIIFVKNKLLNFITD